ncbi:MAG: type II toxin-antitoxin system HicB family antitoxin [Spirochaetales bacterium]|jgi:hypothetical protein|nr:type II toxin-antitoxin system HicB family antitoxin [Spirochaetales bacterium]
MELKYTYTKEKKYLVGYLDDYPEHPTQGIDVKELEANFTEIYTLIQDGTLEVKEHKGVLRVIQ